MPDVQGNKRFRMNTVVMSRARILAALVVAGIILAGLALQPASTAPPPPNPPAPPTPRPTPGPTATATPRRQPPTPGPTPAPTQTPAPPPTGAPSPTVTPPAAPGASPSPGTGPSPSPTVTPPGASVIPVVIALAQEVPPPKPETPRSGTGIGAVVVNAAASELGFAFTYSALSGQLVSAHFHRGARGEAGPIVQTICGEPAPALLGACPQGNSGTLGGVWKIPLQIAVDLQAGRLYVNFHTALNPGGEIRGQVQVAR